MRDDDQWSPSSGHAFRGEIIEKAPGYGHPIILARGAAEEIADTRIVPVCKNPGLREIGF